MTDDINSLKREIEGHEREIEEHLKHIRSVQLRNASLAKERDNYRDLRDEEFDKLRAQMEADRGRYELHLQDLTTRLHGVSQENERLRVILEDLRAENEELKAEKPVYITEGRLFDGMP